MTREEAKGRLEFILSTCENKKTSYALALKMAIEALDMTIESIKQPQIIRCKDCKYRVINEHYGEKGYFKLKAYCDLDTGDIFELGRCAEEDDWFCADAERRTE